MQEGGPQIKVAQPFQAAAASRVPFRHGRPGSWRIRRRAAEIVSQHAGCRRDAPFAPLQLSPCSRSLYSIGTVPLNTSRRLEDVFRSSFRS